MRAFALILFVALALAILIFGPALVGAALAAEGAAVPEPSGWASLEAAVIAFLLGLVTVIGGVILRYLPRLLSAWAELMVERATTARVVRVDGALDEALAAGADAVGAAEIVAEKLPMTLKRSNKGVADLKREAAVKQDALRNRPPRPV